MKKILFYFAFVIILIFTMPLVFTNQFKVQEVSTNLTDEKYDYGEYSNINLLHSQSGQVENLYLDDYLYGVVSSEMPVTFEKEALKAQAVVARTYTIYQIRNGKKHDNADVCDNAYCCQAWISKDDRYSRWENGKEDEYWNKIVQAVNETKGKVILYNGEPINALFHSNSGGRTELSVNVWGGDFPYFQTVETSGESEYTSYSSEVILSKDELIQKMLEKYSGFNIDFASENPIQIIERNLSNRVQKIKIGNIELSGVEARSIFELKSTNFDFEIRDNEIAFKVIGYGHGVGFSQCGSDSLAKSKMSYQDIIKYYYKDVEISE